MKYKLINKITKEEHLCDKLTIDGFDYYVSNNEQPKIDGELYHCKHKGKGIDVGNGKPSQNLIISTYSSKRNLCFDCKKVIATNNSNIDIPKVVDEVERLAESIIPNLRYKKYVKTGFIGGYNKSQETHSFSEEDMVDFAKWMDDNMQQIEYYPMPIMNYKEILQLWKEQQPKIVYYA